MIGADRSTTGESGIQDCALLHSDDRGRRAGSEYESGSRGLSG
jgi:hypothetical protein